ncbi:MAG: hypothetical protein IT189_09550 [Microbacteriaceae bacterium]|nr:hypothetical protein [Microbacteriaceae bacterium]
MLDTINLERRGKPAAVIGLDKLVNTTGKAMARAQGYPTLGFAVFPYSAAEWGSAASEAELKARAESVVGQIRAILTGVEVPPAD